MPRLIIMSSAEVTITITPSITNLEEVRKVNDQIISDTVYSINIGLKELFKKGKIDKLIFEEQLKQSEVELGLRRNAHNDLEQQNQRFSQLKTSNQGETQGFVIEDSITEDELKRLIALTKLQISLIEDKNEKRFLNIILQNAESCKTQLDERRPFAPKTIPIIKSEEQYAFSLLGQFSKFELNQPKFQLIDDYLATLDNIRTIEQAVDHNKSLSRREKEIIHELCAHVSTEIKWGLHAISLNSPINEEQFQKKIQAHIEEAESRKRLTPPTSGFKAFINMICKLLNEESVFKLTIQLNSQLNSQEKINTFKAQFALLNPEPAQEMQQEEQLSNAAKLG